MDDYIASHVGEPISANDIFYWFTFDIMGDLAYGKSFGMLSEHKWHYAIAWMNEFMGLLGPISPVPWLARFLFHVPGVTPKWHRFMDWCQDRMKDRLTMEPNEPDVSTWLIDHVRSDGIVGKPQFDTLHGDAVTMTIAGSDTSAQTLLFIFYHLAKDSTRQNQLRQEIIHSNAQSSDASVLGDCPYLDGFINETLRVHPPVATGAIRQAGPGGIDVAGINIPEGTIIVAPRYCIARRQYLYRYGEPVF